MKKQRHIYEVVVNYIALIKIDRLAKFAGRICASESIRTFLIKLDKAVSG